MTNTYDTSGEPLGSTSVKVLYNNASNLDDVLNDIVNDTWVDRFGRTRKTLKGYDAEFEADQLARRAQFAEFLDGTGWSSLGAYGAGISIISHSQTVDYLGQPYSLKSTVTASPTAPYVTTGNWATEGVNFKLVGDNVLRQDLVAVSGANRVGYSAAETYAANTLGAAVKTAVASIGSVSADLLALTNRVDTADNAIKARAFGYLAVTQSGPSVSLNVNNAGTFAVSITQALTGLNFTGAVDGQRYDASVMFVQGTVGYPVALPDSVKPASGQVGTVPATRYSISLLKIFTVDGGTTWYAEPILTYLQTPPSYLPPIADDNATFNDEGTATTGWTTSNATLSVTGSSLRQTKTAGGSNSSASKSIPTFTPSNSDYVLYIGGLKASSSGTGVIWLLNGSKEVSIWLGSNDASNPASGAISICGTTGSATRNVAQVASGFDYTNGKVDVALQFDQKFTSLTCWFMESDGRYKFKGRVACDWFSAANIQALMSTPSAAGTWVEFDYITLCRPNIVMLSDSIGEGKTLFSPDRSLNLTNDESTWMRHSLLYPTLRNNLIVNKGVGGQTSAQIAARAATDCAGARVVFLHASSNDVAGGISQATRKTNIQNTINTITGLGANTILLNASYGTQSGSDNTPSPALRDYMKTSWDTQLNTVSAYYKLNIMQPLLDSNGFLSSSYAADGIHFNVAGHTAVGAYITTP